MRYVVYVGTHVPALVAHELGSEEETTLSTVDVAEETPVYTCVHCGCYLCCDGAVCCSREMPPGTAEAACPQPRDELTNASDWEVLRWCCLFLRALPSVVIK